MRKTTIILMIFLLLAACSIPAMAQDEKGNNGNDGAKNGADVKETSLIPTTNADRSNGQNVTPEPQEDKNSQNTLKNETGREDGTNPGKSQNVTPEPNKDKNSQNELKNETGREDGTNRDKGQNVSAELKDNRNGSPVANSSELRTNIKKYREELNASERNETPVRRGWIKNENDVRTAVHALLAMENLTGGIGRQVSAIARDFNNSEQSSDRLEAQIHDRGTITRFFFGGDAKAADELANITAQNRIRIQQFQQLAAGASIDPDVQAVYEEQIAVLQADQARLDELAAGEKKDRGLLGWL